MEVILFYLFKKKLKKGTKKFNSTNTNTNTNSTNQIKGKAVLFQHGLFVKKKIY